MDYRRVGGEEQKRCPQCCQWQAWPVSYLGRRGNPVNWCQGCQERYRGWDRLSLAERTARRARHERPIPGARGLRVGWVEATHNVKTGPIPVSTTDRDSCPTSCGYRGRGCYAEESNHTRLHWGRVATRGLTWAAFLARVEVLPRGQLWRHNEAGDLPGVGDRIDPFLLGALAAANAAAGARGFTFTHKPMTAPNARAVRAAVAAGFAINLSADTIAEADALRARAIAPVAVVVPSAWPARATRTPGGATLVVCPAQTTEGMTCERCRLCAAPGRKAIVAFRAHGLRHELASAIARGQLEGSHGGEGDRGRGDPVFGRRAGAPVAREPQVRARTSRRHLPLLPGGPHGAGADQVAPAERGRGAER